MVYEIWSEGFVATGQSSGAIYHGTSEGETFKQACINHANRDKSFNSYFDEERMTFWGCRLYDNGTEARKSFG